jgi:hypothetical protein
MIKQKSGLIVNVSSMGGQTYLFTPAYGIGKAAVCISLSLQNFILGEFFNFSSKILFFEILVRSNGC